MSQVSILNNDVFVPGATIITLTGDIGGPIGPSFANNVNIVGGPGVTVTGNPITHTLTISTAGGAGTIDQFTTDVGGPVDPTANVVILTGAVNQLQTTGSNAPGQVSFGIVTNPIIAGEVTALSFQTSNVTESLHIEDDTITATGTDASVSIVLKSKGAGGKLVYEGIDAGFSNAQFIIGQDGVQTLNDTPTALLILPLVPGEMLTIKGLINGFKSDFTTCIGAELLTTALNGGLVTLAGDPVITIIKPGIDTLNVTVDVSVINTVQIMVTGIAAETFNWVGCFQYFYTQTNA